MFKLFLLFCFIAAIHAFSGDKIIFNGVEVDGTADGANFAYNFQVPSGITEFTATRFDSGMKFTVPTEQVTVALIFDSIGDPVNSYYIDPDTSAVVYFFLAGGLESIDPGTNTQYWDVDFVNADSGCTISDTERNELLSDFNPILLAESSLYITNGDPELRVSFKLPSDYFDVVATYNSQCSNPLTQTSSTNADDGCWTDYRTVYLNYDSECTGFSLTEDTSEFTYRGILYISAKVNFDVVDNDGSSYTLERSVSSPLSWEVRVTRTISVDSQVEIANAYVCNVDADCNDGTDNKEDQEPFNAGIDASPETTGCCYDGVCDCGCTEDGGQKAGVLTGYTGKYCQDDTTDPVCGTYFDATNTKDFDSPHGGCLILGTGGRNLLGTRDATDNSEDYPLGDDVAIQGTTSTDIENYCFPIGQTTVTYTYTDSSSNTKDCSFTVNVIDKASPVIDCYGCQPEDETKVSVCTAVGTKTTILVSDYQSNYGDDYYKTNTHPVVLPGEYYNLAANAFYTGTDARIGYLDCECESASGPTAEQSTKYLKDAALLSGLPRRVVDQADGASTASALTFTTEGRYPNAPYSELDAAGNSASCNIDIILDFTPPTCVGFTDTFYHLNTSNADPDNYNWTETVSWTEDDYLLELVFYSDPKLADDSAGSGFDAAGEPTLGAISPTPAQSNGFAWYIGLKDSEVYSATYTLTDRAGNSNTCAWRVTLIGSGCQWEQDGNGNTNDPCDDTPPTQNYCPTEDITINCNPSEPTDDPNCGCGAFTVPTFKDDKDASNLVITWYINGTLQTTPAANAADVTLALGESTLRFNAADVHGQNVDCSFTVTYQDTTAPTVTVTPLTGTTVTEDIPLGADGCPINHNLCVNSGTTVNYGYQYLGADDCTLDNTDWQTQTEGPTTLTINTNYPQSFTVTNAAGLTKTCSWDVYAQDCTPPEVECPDDQYVRNDQGTTSTTVSITSTATETGGSVRYRYSLDNYVTYFYDGSSADTTTSLDSDNSPHTIYILVTDEANQNDTCNYTYTVLPAYPVGTFEAALTAAVISEVGSGATSATAGDFKADITFITVTNKYHSVTPSINGATNDNPTITGQSISNTPGGTACNLLDEVCVESYDFSTTFTECEAAKAYDLTGTVTCDAPADHGYTGEPACSDAAYVTSGAGQADVDKDFQITLVASNYCWQTLAGVTVTADLITVHETDRSAYETAYDANSATAVLPTEVTVFGNEDEIAGIISVDSPSVNLNSVTIDTATKTHYSDNAYTTAVSAALTNVNVAENLVSRATWASFTYTENQVPLESVHYIKYSATVIVEYNLSAARRLLAASRQILQTEQDSSYEVAETTAVMLSQSPTATITDDDDTVNPNDAIVLLKLNNCAQDSEELSDGIESATAKFLRIAETRVSASIEDTAGECFVHLTLSQSTCDSITITELLSTLEEAIQDPFSELHSYVYHEESIPDDMTIDGATFFVQQQPATILSASSSSTTSTSTSSSSYQWYMYVAAGVAFGAIIGSFAIYFNKSKSNTDIQESNEQRRYSVAELLAATQN